MHWTSTVWVNILLRIMHAGWCIMPGRPTSASSTMNREALSSVWSIKVLRCCKVGLFDQALYVARCHLSSRSGPYVLKHKIVGAHSHGFVLHRAHICHVTSHGVWITNMPQIKAGTLDSQVI